MGTREGFYRYDTIDAGINDLIKTLDMFDDQTNKTVSDALEKGANIILAEQKRLAPPHGDSKRSKGVLKRSLHVGQIYSSKHGRLTTRVGYDFTKNPEAKHAIVQEFGRSAGVDKNGKKVGAMQAYPHIRPALANKGDEAAQVTIDTIISTLNL